MGSILNIRTFYDQARTLLPPDLFHFIDGGSCDEHTLKRNSAATHRLLILPRILQCTKNITTTVPLFEDTIAAPLLIAPTAYQRLLHHDGELATLNAANRFNTIFIVSMFSSTDYGEIAANAKMPLWLQMYLLKDRKPNLRLIRRAEELGYKALVLTVDAPVYGKREREMTSPLQFPNHINFSHINDLGIPFDDCPHSTAHFANLIDPAIGWQDVEWLATVTDLPIILKGVLDPRDTAIALTHPNVKGIIVSNHGGRQLDETVSAFDVMEDHRGVAGKKLMLFLDGGISRGSDIFKAIALGADAALIGRASLWALAVRGSDGVLRALTLLQEELQNVMALTGCSQIKDITRDFIWKD
ncbi:MAG: alpha-hydroxy-acid oxidizing protein [Alphaproteobacteria bacterium]|nr:alpha-hydroxy-acid oxidizing protein [Alphaproteobacteria bacterium]